ncbi:uncharacterized protein [Battus philenor]|uniref:uncharacterized protein isoform X1 n=1 Tax=Battus philenor TaxID=42288 RepID=UPI0035D020B9
MVEKQIGFLYKAASTLAPEQNSHSQYLRSYYLMRCVDITRGYGLPQQQFSVKNRCSHCCLEWTNKIGINVKPLKLSKRQRKRIKQKKRNSDLLHSNKLEQICSFCKNSNVMQILKPKEEHRKIKNDVKNTKITLPKMNLVKKEELEPIQKNIKEFNVYSQSKDVFSLSNKKNVLPNTIKRVPKIVKNDRKKKDKFAGLCRQAVLAAAKLKAEKKTKKSKPDKLSLFLKPCS